jgi:predicted nucleic acid-binding protein
VKAFLDTFALVEMMQGNCAFMPYLQHGVTNQLNLLEFHVRAAREHGEDEADAKLRRLHAKAIPVDVDDVLGASKVKRQIKGASYADALGYAMAQRRRIPFVTGDKAFKGLPGVLP